LQAALAVLAAAEGITVAQVGLEIPQIQALHKVTMAAAV
jgi:hypothetical protein